MGPGKQWLAKGWGGVFTLQMAKNLMRCTRGKRGDAPGRRGRTLQNSPDRVFKCTINYTEISKNWNIDVLRSDSEGWRYTRQCTQKPEMLLWRMGIGLRDALLEEERE